MTTHNTDFLGLFDGTGAPAPAPGMQAPGTQTPSAPAPAQSQQTLPFDDPRMQEALGKARAQERDRYYAEKARMEQEKAEAARRAQEAEQQLAAIKQAEEEARISSLKGDEKWEARMKQMQEQLAERDQRLAETVEEANSRIVQWQVQAELQKIVAHYQGRIDQALLRTESVEALHASIPHALQSYEETRQRFFNEFQQQLGGDRAHLVETLAPGPQPSAAGFPTAPNNQDPAPAAAASGAVPNFEHPQVDGGASYMQARDALHGRVQQAAPPSAGQTMFGGQPQYPMQQPGYTQQPQGYPTQPHINPRVAVPPAPVQGAQPPPLNQPQPGHMPSAQEMAFQGSAPLPDPRLAANGMQGSGRELNGAEANAALLHAQQTIAKFRQNPGGQGGFDPRTGMSLFPGGAPSSHPGAGQPMPQMGGQHPMQRNS